MCLSANTLAKKTAIDMKTYKCEWINDRLGFFIHTSNWGNEIETKTNEIASWFLVYIYHENCTHISSKQFRRKSSEQNNRVTLDKCFGDLIRLHWNSGFLCLQAPKETKQKMLMRVNLSNWFTCYVFEFINDLIFVIIFGWLSWFGLINS